MALVGFKRMTIRVLDGNANPTPGKHLELKDKLVKVRLVPLKFQVLQSDPVKPMVVMSLTTYQTVVLAMKMELTEVDIPSTVLAKI